MVKKSGFQFILALALVAIISSVLWFGAPPAGAMTVDSTDYRQTPLPEANLSITKDDGKTYTYPGDTLTYTVTVTNNSQDTKAENVVVSDTLPDSLSPESASQGDIVGQTWTWTIGELANGASVNATITAKVNADFLGSIAQTASVTSSTLDPDESDNTATDTDISASADLSIAKTDGETNVRPGDDLTYTVTVTNAGPSEAVNVVVTDTLPAGLTAGTVSAGTWSGNTLTWNAGNLAKDATATLTIEATVNDDFSGSIAQIASVTSDTHDPNTDNNTATDTDTSTTADVSITKTDSKTTANPGDVLTYVVTVTNAGPDTARTVKVTDTLPSSLTLQSATPSAGTTWSSPTWTVGDLAKDATATLVIVATVNSGVSGSIAQTASVTSSTHDPNTANNTATDTDTITTSTSLATISSFTPTSGGTGTTVYIYGSNFYNVTDVYFGSYPAQTFYNSSTQITAVVGSGVYSSVKIYVYTSTHGTATSTGYFTFTGTSAQAPYISSFTPTSGGTGTTVNIYGSNLANVSAVYFNGYAAQSFQAYSSYITAVVGSGIAGTTGSVSVTNPYGTDTLSGFTFTTGTTPTPTSGPGVLSLSGLINSSTGVFTSSASLSSTDNNATVTVPQGTRGTLNNSPLTQLTVSPLATGDIPAPPQDARGIAVTYDFGPSGAVFDKPITITIKYDPTLIPAGVDESTLYAVWWDAANFRWVTLEGTVNEANNTITFQVTHFTYFTVMASTRPAQFGVSDLQVSPKEVQAGKEVTISVILGNAGGITGTHDVKLLINGNAVSTKPVTLAGNTTQKVTFTTVQNTPGTYTAAVEYLSAKFVVVAAPATTPATTSPAVTTPAPTATKTTPAATATSPATASPTTTKPADGEGTPSVNWWLIGAVIVIFLIIVWIVYRIIIYQRRSTH